MLQLRGSFVALVTPFTSDDRVNHALLRELVEWHIEQGTDGLVPVGTTGESPTLTYEEHEAVIETAVEAAAGRIPVVPGTGSNSTREAVHMTQHAKLVGADGALIVLPYYNRPSQA
ncbi:MAG TPA: dihydrodipicolinate synthase family protein, partial [Candidatus Latescibacteria bacterium]|nr:dihydrodipicolinate synthase family protein [Candidatus Latescibacterota bacterium]